jgi:hypothetical protein
VGPAAQAGEPFARPRPWFALVPRADLAPAASASLAASVVLELPGGQAIRTEPLSLEGARRAVAPILRDAADVTLYPIDD